VASSTGGVSFEGVLVADSVTPSLSRQKRKEYTECHSENGAPFCDNEFVARLPDIVHQNTRHFLHKQNCELLLRYVTYIVHIIRLLQLPANFTVLKFIYQYISLFDVHWSVHRNIFL